MIVFLDRLGHTDVIKPVFSSMIDLLKVSCFGRKGSCGPCYWADRASGGVRQHDGHTPQLAAGSRSLRTSTVQVHNLYPSSVKSTEATRFPFSRVQYRKISIVFSKFLVNVHDDDETV